MATWELQHEKSSVKKNIQLEVSQRLTTISTSMVIDAPVPLWTLTWPPHETLNKFTPGFNVWLSLGYLKLLSTFVSTANFTTLQIAILGPLVQIVNCYQGPSLRSENATLCSECCAQALQQQEAAERTHLWGVPEWQNIPEDGAARLTKFYWYLIWKRQYLRRYLTITKRLMVWILLRHTKKQTLIIQQAIHISSNEDPESQGRQRHYIALKIKVYVIFTSEFSKLFLYLSI